MKFFIFVVLVFIACKSISGSQDNSNHGKRIDGSKKDASKGPNGNFKKSGEPNVGLKKGVNPKNCGNVCGYGLYSEPMACHTDVLSTKSVDCKLIKGPVPTVAHGKAAAAGAVFKCCAKPFDDKNFWCTDPPGSLTYSRIYFRGALQDNI